MLYIITMSAYSFDPTKWGGRAWKPAPRRVLPVIVINTPDRSVDVNETLKQYNIPAPVEVYTISMETGVWCLQHGEACTPLPCSDAEGMVLWLKNELENKESEMIPLPGKGYRPVLCLLGELLDGHLPMFREGRAGKMYVVTDVEGPTLPSDKTVGLRQFYRNVESGDYGPYHDKVEFHPDGSITIEGCETEYSPELGLAVAACLSTGNCTLSRAVQ
jgi:hypothetical protein